MDVPRAFVALDLDAPTLDALEAKAGSLRASAPSGVSARWTRRDQMHVTLKFLGAATEKQAEALACFVSSFAERPATVLGVPGLGAFPDETRARIVMARIEDARAGALGKMQEATEEYAASVGFAREGRRYAPHVTLARLGAPVDARAWLEGVRAEPRLARATAMVLYRSHPSPGGSRYEAIVRAPFAVVAA